MFGRLVSQFSGFHDSSDHRHFNHELRQGVLYLVYIAVGMFVATYIYTVGFIYAGEHVVRRTREQYLAALLRQNIAFFDTLGAGESTTRITANTTTMQDGISEKIGLAVSAFSTFVAALVVSFVYNWRLALILSPTIVVTLLTLGACSSWMVKWTVQAQEAYNSGGTLAEEVLSTMRNTTAFSTQNKLANHYYEQLSESTRWGKKTQSMLGFMIATAIMVTFLNYVCGLRGFLLLLTSDRPLHFGKARDTLCLARQARQM